jgi:hypothetical protein
MCRGSEGLLDRRRGAVITPDRAALNLPHGVTGARLAFPTHQRAVDLAGPSLEEADDSVCRV